MGKHNCHRKKVEIKLDELGEKKLVGFIDRLVYNIESNEIEIHDYKTANTFPAISDLEKNRQLALYSIAIKERIWKRKKYFFNLAFSCA